MKFNNAFSKFEEYVYSCVEQQWAERGLSSPKPPQVDWKGYSIPDWVDLDHSIIGCSQELNLLDDWMEPSCVPNHLPDYRPNVWMAFVDGEWVVKFPDGDSLYVLDIETNLLSRTKLSEVRATYSVVAYNCSTQVWYLYQGDGVQRLYPFSRNNVIVGHNVQYDRGYCSTEYETVPSGNSWLCTMSLFIQLRGVSNKQQKELDFAVSKARWKLTQGWMSETAEGLSLAAVYQFYKGKTLDKGIRDNLLVAGSLIELRVFHNDILQYNISDVFHTAEVFSYLYREWLLSDPEPISRLGLLKLSQQRVPVDQSRLSDWSDASEKLYQEKLSSKVDLINEAFRVFVQDTVHNGVHHPQIPLLDNTPAKSGKNKGLPAWARKVKGLTVYSDLTPIVLRLTYAHDLDNPKYEMVYQDTWYNEVTKKHHKCYRTAGGWVMNPAKPGFPLQDMFCNDALDLYQTGQVEAETNTGKEVVLFLKETAVYTSFRKRIEYLRNHVFNGFILVTNLTPGTISGRCSHKIFQVMPNTKFPKLGTELKHMVQVPIGYSRVGADFDSQEAVIGAIYADMATGNVPMGNMFSQMVLCGDKKTGTTPHLLIQEASNVGGVELEYVVCKNVFYAGCNREVNNMHHFRKARYNNNEDMKLAHSRVMTLLYGSPDGKCTSGGGGLLSPLYETTTRISKGACRTIMLNRCITKTLHGYGNVNTKANWVIQSCAVDMLRLAVVYTQYLAMKSGIHVELMVTVHDEISFMCRQSDHKKLVAIMQIAHSIVWARLFKSARLSAIPAFRYFYSAVEVDTTWRKDVNDNGCTKHNTAFWTPSPSGSYCDIATGIERPVISYKTQDIIDDVLSIAKECFPE